MTLDELYFKEHHLELNCTVVLHKYFSRIILLHDRET